MKRGGPLRRLTPLAASKGLAPVSKVRKAVDARERAILARIRRRDGERCRLASPKCWGPVDVHHVLPRGRGGLTVDENLICLCRAHHGWAHDNPGDARVAGVLR